MAGLLLARHTRDSVQVHPIIDEPAPVRARNDKGQLKADDPSTKKVNEAWVGGQAPKKLEEKIMAKTPAWTRKEGKNPKGGLNAKGRASYKRYIEASRQGGDNRRASFLARMGI